MGGSVRPRVGGSQGKQSRQLVNPIKFAAQANLLPIGQRNLFRIAETVDTLRDPSRDSESRGVC
ncbi:hypothetical protein CGZ80_24655 [Rhodopirellula sp. MGV]|nr:hypothetical protein CGZ80_24655 [Rhodopirellula sp. MGV]PNY35708.1 hypothetical protein C2E31_16610 [Rhodopirellula baltica]